MSHIAHHLVLGVDCLEQAAWVCKHSLEKIETGVCMCVCMWYVCVYCLWYVCDVCDVYVCVHVVYQYCV